MGLRSLPQNKALIGSDQLSKLRHFAWKSVPTIRTLSSRTDGTIATRRSRGTCWDLEMEVDAAEDGGAMAASRGLARALHEPPPLRVNLHEASSVPFSAV